MSVAALSLAAPIEDVAQVPIIGPGQKGDLCDELRPDPTHPAKLAQ
jgi:hypothetical protein